MKKTKTEILIERILLLAPKFRDVTDALFHPANGRYKILNI